MNKKVLKTKNYYNGIAKGYSQLYHEEQIKKINYVKQQFLESGTILDLGSGDGVLNQFISKKVNLFSVDLSEELLKLNSNKQENKFVLDICDLSILKDDYFDQIISFSVIQDIENFEKVILEAKRILKQNGSFILSFVKFSSKKDNILEFIKNNFEIIKEFEEEKDLIFMLINN